MLANEQRRAAHSSPGRAQLFRQRIHRIRHLPRAFRPDRGTKRGLDAVRGTDPVRPRDVAGRVARARPIIRRREVSRDRSDRHRSSGPPLLCAAQDPLEHEMRHVGGGDDLVISVRGAWCVGQPTIEEHRPIRRNELAIGSLAELAACLAIGIVIDHDDGAIVGLATRFRFGELRRVKRAVTPATDDDDVPQRISLPPSTTRIVPVT